MKRFLKLFLLIFLVIVMTKDVNASVLNCSYDFVTERGDELNLSLHLFDSKLTSNSDFYYKWTNSDNIKNGTIAINKNLSMNFQGYVYYMYITVPNAYLGQELTECPVVNIAQNNSNISVVVYTPSNPVKEPSKEQTGLSSGVTVPTSYCDNPNFVKPFKLLGRIFSVVKILIPLIIIVFGIVDFFKAMIGSKDDEIKKSARSLIMRVIAGVVIFFLPAIVHFVFKLVDEWSNYENDYSKCSLCLTEPNKC